ncbi:MAG: family 20 glycosylhydrolase [Sphingobacteriales bacterium]
MKRIIVWALLMLSGHTFGQIKSEGKYDQSFPTFYQQRSSLFRVLPETKNDIIFLGNSITNGSEWGELFGDQTIKNRGISGDVTAGVLNRLDEVTSRKPSKVFLLIGVNDLAAGHAPDSVVKNIFLIADRIHRETPGTQLYVQSMLPVNNTFNKFPSHVNKEEQIKQTDLLLEKGATAHQYTFINLYPSFTNAQQQLDTAFTNDGLHEKGRGYMLWKHLIYPYVYDLQAKPSIVPLPRSISWTNGLFPLYRCHYIVVTDTIFRSVAVDLQRLMLQKGLNVKLSDDVLNNGEPEIILEHQNVFTYGINEEAYKLQVNSNRISIMAGTPHGCFNAIQTLAQLMRDNCTIDGVTITDYPAFNWRGYMVDVGRNFESVDMLKQQIEVMARYKLNVFHLHLTEDIAWRLQIKQYPQLTQADNMERNKGAFYTVDELKDLIKFCKERYITLIPEIDMPGHSAAFTRAFHCNMQSDSGMLIVKNIMKEVCDEYDIPYLHVGGDEVKITNENFLPAIIQFIHEQGKKTIAWSPGGNLDTATIRQLWMKKGSLDPQISYIDSRNLYINHMDPLESVISIFNRKIDDCDSGSVKELGGILCLWPDRNVLKQEDILTMNPVYPAMLTFAERSWRGGGIDGWHTDIIDSANFSDFENRLIDQQKQYFADMPFPYIKQSGIKWKLYGPYINKGVLTIKFAPEKKGFRPRRQKYLPVTGGTIILRHFWFPEVRGVLIKPADSTTYYAVANVWSTRDTSALMWIGFYNISRSVATPTPELNTWDNRSSEIWINGELISPPHWAHAGEKGNIENPLTDESYEYRAPTAVHMHQGWNQVLIKLPVGSLRSGSWKNPVKWMFTAVFVKPLGKNFTRNDQFTYSNN